jgi:hypothetical protein
MLAVGAALFDREDLGALAQDHDERAIWLLGEKPGHDGDETESHSAAVRIESRGLSASGYYLLQAGHVEQPDRVSVLFDCGDLGFGSIAAHGHADALNFTLRAFGHDVIVDPGTYDYFTWQRWRDYFRSTRAHNCVVVDDSDQSEMTGPFLWGQRASARCVLWKPTRHGGAVAGEHTGDLRLADPVLHRRTIELDANTGRLTVLDELTGRAEHKADLMLHFAEGCSVTDEGGGRVSVGFAGGLLQIALDPRLEVSLHEGEEQPPLGWISRNYHRKTATISLAATYRWTGKLELRTAMTLTSIDTGVRTAAVGHLTSARAASAKEGRQPWHPHTR